ncbi:MAG: 2-pyrone-4,6-dicarboxylate hydrolase [Betaproteobacteria bacterium]|nr:2-pyrone-4,6-dicarboxylate hydrolase [Betaproteobacteria bacterium]
MAAIFDTHFHIVDPRFPVMPNQGFLPPIFTVDDYLSRTAGLGITGGTVVAGSFQGTQTEYMVDALAKLGPTFVGVIQVPATVTDEEILRLNAAGVRAVRFNLYRGGSAGIEDLDRLARRVHDVAGWHAELYADASTLEPIMETVANLPKISIDHLGMTQAGLPNLLALVGRGAKVKATGFGRTEVDVPHALREIARVNPSSLMFGTDLPSQRARRPFERADIDLIRDTLGDALAQKAFRDNAVEFYRPREIPNP